MQVTSKLGVAAQSTPVVSSEERRNRLMAKRAKAEGAVVVAELDFAHDAARSLTEGLTDEQTENVGALVVMDAVAVNAAEKRVTMLDKAIGGLDVPATEADIRWASNPVNRSKLGRIVRLVPKGTGRLQAIVAQIRKEHAIDAAIAKAEAAKAEAAKANGTK